MSVSARNAPIVGPPAPMPLGGHYKRGPGRSKCFVSLPDTQFQKISNKMSMSVQDCAGAREGFPRPFPDTPTNVLQQFQMKGKVVIITGAADGLGYAVAESMAEAGAHVALWYNSSVTQTAMDPPTMNWLTLGIEIMLRLRRHRTWPKNIMLKRPLTRLMVSVTC